jgi:hypothetical protein
VKTFKRHLTVANVLSCIALFVALSATAVAATKLSTGQVKAVNIANEAVTTPKIKKLAVNNSKLGKESVTSGKIKKLSVTNPKLGKESVTSGKLKKQSVTSTQLGPEAVTTGKLGGESVSAAKLSASLYSQLIKNVTYVNTATFTDTEPNKTATATCPTGKEAIAGGVRLEGELKEVATTASYPFSSGSLRTGWTGIAHESGAGPYGDWSIVVFAVCAEL